MKRDKITWVKIISMQILQQILKAFALFSLSSEDPLDLTDILPEGKGGFRTSFDLKSSCPAMPDDILTGN
jgi:hypothetical protein